MDCSNCAAPMRLVPGGDHFVCDFCGSFHFPEKSQDGVRVIGEPGERQCPVCRQPLVAAVIERIPVEHCPQCRGVLADRRSFNRIIRQLRARHAGPRLDPIPIDAAARQRQLDCPGCSRTLEVHPYYGPGNVLLDSCGRCGLVWLDHGEIATISRS